METINSYMEVLSWDNLKNTSFDDIKSKVPSWETCQSYIPTIADCQTYAMDLPNASLTEQVAVGAGGLIALAGCAYIAKKAGSCMMNRKSWLIMDNPFFKESTKRTTALTMVSAAVSIAATALLAGTALPEIAAIALMLTIAGVASKVGLATAKNVLEENLESFSVKQEKHLSIVGALLSPVPFVGMMVNLPILGHKAAGFAHSQLEKTFI